MGIFSASADPVAVGAPGPVATALTETGASLNLADVYAKGVTLVYFYPKADTGGCTAQACSIRDAFAELTQKGVTVLGVSTDGVEAQKAFREKYSLPFTLLADTDKKVVEAFGVPAMGGYAARQAFLIKDGKVVWRDLKASTKQQAADVLAALQQLGS